MFTTSPGPSGKNFLNDNDMVETSGMADGRYKTMYGVGKMGHGGKPVKRVGIITQLDRVDDFDGGATSAGEENMTLPRIGNSMEIHSISERDTKRRSNNMGSKSVDQPRTMGTIPIIDSLGNESEQRAIQMNSTMRDSYEQTTSFDTKKWKRMINGNVEMIQKKVDQSTPHHVLYRELDDLKMIVSNCFD